MKKIDVLNMIAKDEADGYIDPNGNKTSMTSLMPCFPVAYGLNNEGYEPILKEKQWYEEDDRKGKLCWFWDNNKVINNIGIFHSEAISTTRGAVFMEMGGQDYLNAQPLTEAEALALVYKTKEDKQKEGAE